MTGNVKAALAIVREHAADEWSHSMQKLAKAQATLANAFAALHPADSGEPITPDWLERSGYQMAEPFIYCHDDRPTVEMFSDGTSEVIMSGTILPHINTRGDLRRLLAALGVELKELA